MTDHHRDRENRGGKGPPRDDDLEKTIGPDGPDDGSGEPFDAEDFHADSPSEPSTVDDFAECLTVSGLMSAQKLEAFLEGLDTDETPRDAQSLAEILVRYGKLTSYQAEVLSRGRTRGLVLGNYEIQKRLGTGGMSTVFKAQHRRMKRTVALKVLPPSLTKSRDAVDRFYREMEVVAKLQHPNIAAAYDADTSDGIHFIVMEMVEGPNLDSYVQEAGNLPVPVGVQLTIQAARGLQHAHSKGVVHRDIKPSNFLVDQQGTLKILDMGLAQLKGGADEQQRHLTQPGRVMGTVDYMAPEQAVDAASVDHRADVYSLGCTLFFLLTARTLAPDGPIPAKLIWHASKAPPRLSDVCREAPEELDRVFQKMVSKQPNQRQQTMGEVEHDLDQVLANLSDGTELPLQGNDLARYIGLSIVDPSSLPMPAPIIMPAPVAEQPHYGPPAGDFAMSGKLDAILIGLHLTAASSMIGKLVRAVGNDGEFIEGVVDGVSVDPEDHDRHIQLHIGANRVLLASVREVLR